MKSHWQWSIPAAAALLIPCALRADTIRLTGLRAIPAGINANLLPNPGFESDGGAQTPRYWRWNPRNTNAKQTLAAPAHSGRRCLRFTDSTPLGANVYGNLVLETPLALEAGKTYTLSVWTKSVNPGVACMGGPDIRLALPPTGGRWRRVWATLHPKADEIKGRFYFNIDSPTAELLVDDIKVEAGAEPTPFVPAGGGAFQASSLMPAPDSSAMRATDLTPMPGDGAFSLAFSVYAPRAISVVIDVSIPGSRAHVARRTTIRPGAWRIDVSGDASAAGDQPRTAVLRLLAGRRELTRCEAPVRFLSAAAASRRIAALRARLPGLEAQIHRLRAHGRAVDYPLVSYTVLENFVRFAAEDAGLVSRDRATGVMRPLLGRAFMQIAEMERLADRLERNLRDAAAGRMALPSVPRWTGTVRPSIRGSAFVAPVTVSGAAGTHMRPVFFNGFGHFGQVEDDIEKFPRYGYNIIQIEVGPNSVFPGPNTIDDAPIRRLSGVLKRAERAGVAVCLLISPHYFPEWMLREHPEMRKHRDGFLQYCIHAPEGQALLRRYLATLIPPLKHYPALHSICLSNEPSNLEEPCAYATDEWHGWLRTRYGSVDALNAHWRARYSDFAAVPLPDPFSPPYVGRDDLASPNRSPIWNDFVRFNQVCFANWHHMMADAIHAVAPDLPVHAKAMTGTMINGSDARYGVDAQLFAAFSDINGNDGSCSATPDDSDFAMSWQLNEMAYDLQRSQKDAPVFNSENHLVDDADTTPVAPEFVRAVLWQDAVHGQSATTIWIWQRSLDLRNDVPGSLMYRPSCADAVGRLNLDLNRGAEEMTAVQAARPDIYLLQSVSASSWDAVRYSDCMQQIYTALAFTGLKVGFVTERQLEAGVLPAGPLFVPDIVHLSDPSFRTLRRFRGRLFLVGGPDLLSRDDADNPRSDRLSGRRVSYRYGSTGWRSILAAVRPQLGSPRIEVRDASGKPVWGVEWHSAAAPHGAVASLCNFRQKDVRISLWSHGRPVGARDVLSGGVVRGPLVLHSLEVRLLRFRAE